MEYQLSSTSMAPLVEISLNNNEEIQIESGAMVYHNAAVKLEGKMNSNGKGGLGGALKALGRSITSGESFFITKASAIGKFRLLLLALVQSRKFLSVKNSGILTQGHSSLVRVVSIT